MLKLFSQVFLLGTLLAASSSFGVEVDARTAASFLLSHQKPNGAFGPRGQQHTDLAWNYPAVHALVLLDEPVPRARDAFQNGRGAAYLEKESHHKTWSWDVYQRAQLARVLGVEPGPEYDLTGEWKLEYVDRKGWYYPRIDARKLNARTAQFNELSSLWHFVAAVTLSGGTIANPEVALGYLLPRQCPSGAFEDAYLPEPPPDESAAHLVATAEAVLTLQALNLDVPNPEACARWIRSCQAEDGGFRWHPSNEAHGNKPDVWYTWYALQVLRALGSEPANPEGCLRWLNSLQNADGGFADRPGWSSRLYSTYYAIHALEILTGDAREAVRRKNLKPDGKTIPEGTYSIFQAHLKSPTGGAEMVALAHEMGFHFLGVKTNNPDGPRVTVEAAREITREKGYRLELVGNPENYHHNLKWLGGHPGHHASNWLLPPNPTDGQKEAFSKAHAAGGQGLPWAEYKVRVIAPVQEIGTLFYPEMDYTMMNAYMVYDDGLDGRPGYNAVIGALGWPGWDWIRMFPYRERWVGQLPIVADGDAHGDIEKWRERLERQRILYFAREHDLAGFLEACREGRTVCVIRGGKDRSELVLYGAPAAVAYARKHFDEWKWWD